MSDSHPEDTIDANDNCQAMKLLLQQERDWSEGRHVLVEQILAEHPTLAEQSEVLLDLIHNEVLLRKRIGEVPVLADYQQRFPVVSEALRIQWAVEQFLFSGDVSDSGPTDYPLAKMQHIGRYQVQSMLGHGGIGVAYKAWDPMLKRVVALKLLKSGRHATAQELARFRIEAEAIARVRHANVVQVYDVGEMDGEPFIAMEYCGGGNLADRLKGTCLPAPEAALLARQIAEGVAAAHQMHIVHRDLKPSNVLIKEEGESQPEGKQRLGTPFEPKVSDFGLAKLLDTDDGQTHTGAILGTPAYMAPEQAFGTPGMVGPAVDIYALGALLYVLLTGRPPFRGSSAAETLEQIRNDEPVSVRHLHPSVPVDLETIALHCLQKDPAKRYLSASAVVEDLTRFLEGKPILARPVGALQRAGRWCRRNPRLAGLLGAVASLLITVAVGTSLSAVWLKDERDTARAAELRATKAERARTQELYRASINEVRARRGTGRQGQRLDALVAVRQLLAAVPRDQFAEQQVQELRDEVIACLALPDLQEVRLGQSSGSSALHDVDTDLSLDYYAVEDEGASVVRRWSDPAFTLRLDPHGLNSPFFARRFSPDGQWLTELLGDLKGKDQVRVWDWRNHRKTLDVQIPVLMESVSYSPDGKRLAVASPDRTVHIYDPASGREVSHSPPRFRSTQTAFAPDGRSLAIANDALPALIVDPETWQDVAVLAEAGRSITVAWNPDGREVAFGNRAGEVYLWNFDSRIGRLLAGRHHGEIFNIQFTADGRWLASSGTDSVILLWDRKRDQPALQLPGRFLRGSADSRQLAVVHGRDFRVYQWADSSSYQSLPYSGEGATFDPSGRWLAVGGLEGVRLFAADTLELVADLGLDLCGPPIFRPDGKELLTFGVFSHAQRWPIHLPGAGDTERALLGPPHPVLREEGADWLTRAGLKLSPQHQGRHAAWNRDGQLLVLADNRDGHVLIADPNSSLGVRRRAHLRSLNRVAVSPNGQWIAGTNVNGALTVWPASDGEAVLTFPDQYLAVFSPDGQHLISGGPQKYQFFRVGTWKLEGVMERNELGFGQETAIAYRPDGRLVALATSRRQVKLVDRQTLLVVATLTHPDPAAITWLSFDSTGTRLAVTRQGADIVVWNLKHLNGQLREFGLECASFEPAGNFPVLPSMKVSVDRGTKLPAPHGWAKKWMLMAAGEELEGRPGDAIVAATEALRMLPPHASRERAEILAARGSWHRQNAFPEAAREDWQNALVLTPDLTTPIRGLARLFVLGPVPLRDAPRGLVLAWKAIERQPKDAEMLTVLAIAYSRMGRHHEALDTIEKILPEAQGPLAYYCRALCKHRLGDATGAAADLKAGQDQHGRVYKNLPTPQADELRMAQLECQTALTTVSKPKSGER